MENPLHAMLFAEDLISSFMLKSGITQPDSYSVMTHRETINAEFLTDEIIEAVDLIRTKHQDTIRCWYAQLLERKVTKKEAFRMESCITTVYNFPRGYSHVRFLNLCALLAGLSVLFARDGNFEIADASAQVLAYVLNFFIYMLTFDPKCSWFELSYTAAKVARVLKATTTKKD